MASTSLTPEVLAALLAFTAYASENPTPGPWSQLDAYLSHNGFPQHEINMLIYGDPRDPSIRIPDGYYDEEDAVMDNDDDNTTIAPPPAPVTAFPGPAPVTNTAPYFTNNPFPVMGYTSAPAPASLALIAPPPAPINAFPAQNNQFPPPSAAPAAPIIAPVTMGRGWGCSRILELLLKLGSRSGGVDGEGCNGLRGV